MEFEKDRYEALEIIVKSRLDGESWFDIISEVLIGDCQGSETEPCTCGTESMTGSVGTLDQCWKHLGISEDIVEVNTDDLRLILSNLDVSNVTPSVTEAVARLYEDLNWWNEWSKDSNEEKE